MTLDVQNLRVTPFGADSAVLDGVTFSLKQGEKALLLGPSGAGKSTLMLAISGVLQQLETADVAGTLVAASSGLLLQNATDSAICDTVYRDVAFGAESAGVARLSIAGLVEAALDAVGLGELDKGRNPQTLSGGELQRMCLAGLLALKPRLLLLDEPTSYLDDESAAEVRDAVSEYLRMSGATALIAEHIFEAWLPLVDKIFVLDASGRLVAAGDTDEVLKRSGRQLADWGMWVAGGDPLHSLVTTAETGGHITALVGRSGSGKTTWLNQYLRSSLETAPVGGVGWLPQNPANTLTGNTVLESLTATALALGEDPKLTQQGGQEWLRRMGLEGMRNRNPHELSGGETRRLALASAFMHKPGLVYLDEPTVGLDTLSWKNVVDAILEAKHSGARIYLATHDAQLLKLADEVITLEPKSAPIAQATKPQLFSPLAMFAASALTLAGALAFRSVSAAALALFAEAILMALAMWLVPSLRRFGLLWPMAFGVASVGFSNWWLSDAHSVEAAALVAIRVAFFGLPGLLLAAAASPSELGDQLGQKLRIPARPVVAAMVGLNRVHRLRGNWASLAFVRKVRLVAKKGLAEYWSLILFSLIEATRSAESTAIAMESRGFSAKDATGKPVPRTWAIEATWGKLDLLLLAAAAGCVALGLFGL